MIKNSKMKFNKNAFLSVFDKKYRNWDGYSLAYTYDFIEAIEKIIDLNAIEIIFDIGSRDACQALEFSDWFPQSKIYCFEPVPQNADWCRQNIKNRENIFFEQIVISEKNEEIDFFVVKNGNIGASSILKANKNHFYGNTYDQEALRINSTRAETFIKMNNLPNVDLLWMDVQGAELNVLKSFADELKNIKAIHTEVALSHVYENATLKNELIEFMKNNNFDLIKCITNQLGIEEDLVFVNRKFFI